MKRSLNIQSSQSFWAVFTQKLHKFIKTITLEWEISKSVHSTNTSEKMLPENYDKKVKKRLNLLERLNRFMLPVKVCKISMRPLSHYQFLHASESFHPCVNPVLHSLKNISQSSVSFLFSLFTFLKLYLPE